MKDPACSERARASGRVEDGRDATITPNFASRERLSDAQQRYFDRRGPSDLLGGVEVGGDATEQ